MPLLSQTGEVVPLWRWMRFPNCRFAKAPGWMLFYAFDILYATSGTIVKGTPFGLREGRRRRLFHPAWSEIAEEGPSGRYDHHIEEWVSSAGLRSPIRTLGLTLSGVGIGTRPAMGAHPSKFRGSARWRCVAAMAAWPVPTVIWWRSETTSPTA